MKYSIYEFMNTIKELYIYKTHIVL